MTLYRHEEETLMFHTRVLIIGAGQAGLSVSKQLTDAGVDHVVLERGRTAERWTSQRWDSLRLLTPNWMSRLPGWSYRGSDPSGFMSGVEVAEYLTGYAGSFGAPIIHGAEVRLGAPARRRLSGRQRCRDLVRRCGCHRHRVLRSARRTLGRRDPRSVGSTDHPRPVSQSWRRPRRSASWSSGPPRPASSSLTNWQPPEEMSSWRSAGTPGSPVGTGEWTSCGGWTRWACSTGS